MQKDDVIYRQAAIDALAKQMPTPYTPDGSHPADEGIFQVQEVYADCIKTLELLPSAQPEPERTMEEFMYGQDMGNPEDGSL